MKDESFSANYKTGLSLLIRVTLVSFFSDCVAAKSFFNPEFLKIAISKMKSATSLILTWDCARSLVPTVLTFG